MRRATEGGRDKPLLVATFVDQNTNVLTINLKATEDTNEDELEAVYSLYSLDGKLINEVSSSSNSVKMLNIRSGIYILTATKAGQVGSQKVYVH